MICRCVVILVLLAAVPGIARASGTAGWVEGRINAGGRLRHYLLFQPESLPSGVPLVLFLQGNRPGMRSVTGSAAGGAVEWSQLARLEKFILLVPDGTDHKTGETSGERQGRLPAVTAGGDAEFIGRLLDELVRSHKVDPFRIYVTGHAGGAVKAADLLLATRPRFAAAALFSLALPSALASSGAGYRPCPLMLMYGTADPLVPGDRTVLQRSGETVMPYRESAGWWVVANRAEAADPALSLLPDLDPRDGCRIRKAAYRALKGGAPVMVYTVEGGGHAIPARAHGATASAAERRFEGLTCRDADGIVLAWEFMKGFRLSDKP